MNKKQQQQHQNDLILIRHAQSQFNLGFYNYLKSKQWQFTTTIWDYCLQQDDFNDTVTYSKQFIDPHISQIGYKQCQKAKQKLIDQQIDIILVSPYQRALQTCHQIFGDRNVKIEVVPILAEVFKYACDINHDLQEKIKKYYKYDFNKMEGYSQLWFFHHLKDHHLQTYQSHLESQEKDQKDMTLQQKHEILLKLLRTKKIQQIGHQLRQRVWKIKQLLSQYKKTYNKIAIVSHFHVLLYLLATQFNQHSQSNVKFVENAQPIYKNLKDLMKIK